ncbi:glycosyl hydrolases family 31-domain-containing protein, partial [Jimgerdemannia flammicorona]
MLLGRQKLKPLLLPLLLLSVFLLHSSIAVKRDDFKTCDQAAFCRRNRAYADKALADSGHSPYALLPESIRFDDGLFTADVRNTLTNIILTFELHLLEDNTARLRINEKKPLKPRYDELPAFVLAKEPVHIKPEKVAQDQDGTTIITLDATKKTKVVVSANPLRVDFLVDDVPVVSLNDRGFFNFEHLRKKPEPEQPKMVDQSAEQQEDAAAEVTEQPEEERQLWEETFKTWTDPKPNGIQKKKKNANVTWNMKWNHDNSRSTYVSFIILSYVSLHTRGPESVAMDISFPGFAYVYGVPEHASSLSLKETRYITLFLPAVQFTNVYTHDFYLNHPAIHTSHSGGDNAYTEPYRLYNLDVFEYEVDNPMALYGSIPFMLAHRKDLSAAVFWMNAAETWIDVVKTQDGKSQSTLRRLLPFVTNPPTKSSTHTHWISEAGIVDLFVFLGPTNEDIFRQYTALTGAPAMPASFAIAYHQCRWNYINQNDVAEVDAGFDTHDIPYDVIWLDIEHTDGKRYMTWDEAKFPDPMKMQNELAAKGRKLVTIVDPHIKHDDNYHISKEAQDLGLFVKTPAGDDYEGWCWPGSSSWVDYTNPAARNWWIKKFAFDQYKHTTENLHIWNDMNEPSVFNGPEITMQKEMIHHGQWEHRVLHNVFGTIY